MNSWDALVTASPAGLQVVPPSSVIDELKHLLDFLPVLYPGGMSWLEHRLDDISRGNADLVVAVSSTGAVVGAAIGMPKPSGRYKICTLFVRADHRGSGLGASLLTWCLERARASSSTAAYITSASTVRELISPVLTAHGFEHISRVKDRYGRGRDEDVFQADL